MTALGLARLARRSICLDFLSPRCVTVQVFTTYTSAGSEKLTTDRAAKARYILAYLLAHDHGANDYEIGTLIGRSPGMAKHGRYFIEKLLAKKDSAVIQAIAQIRIRYQAP